MWVPVVLLLLRPLPVLLDLDDQRLEPVGKELPGEDLALVEGSEELVEALEDGRPVHRHHVELAVEAPEKGLHRLVVDRSKVDSCTLGYLVIKNDNAILKEDLIDLRTDVIHAGDEMTKGVSET